MDTDITLDNVYHAIKIIENHSVKRDYKSLDEILPLVYSLLKYKAADIKAEANGEKYYVPVWVDRLVYYLDNLNEPISDVDYEILKSKVAQLRIEHFKYPNSGILGYKAKYLTYKEFDNLFSSLKRYFGLNPT